jgi:hypothetical protein
MNNLLNSIDESTPMAAINPVIGANNPFFIQYGKSNTFAKSSDEKEVDGYAISNDIVSKNILTVDKDTGEVKKEDSAFLNGRKLRIFKCIKNNNKDKFKNIIESIGSIKYREYFYEELTGKKLLSDDQILCDECFEEVDPLKINESKNSIVQTIIDEYKSIIGEEVIKIPLMNDIDIRKANSIIKENVNVEIFENLNGYFAENAINRKRTAYFSKIDDITIDSII